MKNRDYLKETLEFYSVTLIIYGLFFGGIILSGALSGHQWAGLLPDLSWDMINTWNDISNATK
ncbi:hypothetical protein GH741_17435 [Aquibacillus halophilus]|uniref:Uncharacterized protein n=1 Tax=Aquibacillus halophilus TaxID=930132 RepID=A0A6A8DL02_9BACI|nr:hypothetical protein [Aquibacillus halophilus]MRH44429.1 hypothetical protein [Aquibacillus halophilus]